LSRNAADTAAHKENAAELQQRFLKELPFMMLYCRTYSVAHTADLTISTDIRDTNLFNSIEKWYFNAEGRARYTLEYAELDFYGVPALKAPVLDEPEATPQPVE